MPTSSAHAYLNPNFAWSQKFDPIDDKQFLLRDEKEVEKGSSEVL